MGFTPESPLIELINLLTFNEILRLNALALNGYGSRLSSSARATQDDVNNVTNLFPLFHFPFVTNLSTANNILCLH